MLGISRWAGDESAITKAGKKIHGLDCFYAGLFNKPVQSIAIFALSLIDTLTRQFCGLINLRTLHRIRQRKAALRRHKNSLFLKFMANPANSRRTKIRTALLTNPMISHTLE